MHCISMNEILYNDVDLQQPHSTQTIFTLGTGYNCMLT